MKKQTPVNREDLKPRLAPLPAGKVTFLFSDVQGSTRLWEEHPEKMQVALERHDRIIESLTAMHNGRVVKPRGEGDSRFCVFACALDAITAASGIQRALQDEPWQTPAPIHVRMALNTGEAELREGDYFGNTVNRCARLRAVAHGGQTLLSRATYDQVREAPPPGINFKDLGEHHLKDLSTPERIYQLITSGTPCEFPPLPTQNPRLNNLPAQLTSFVGRERETREVARLLAGDSAGQASGIRLLTLTGPGGTGKTRLALQVAAVLAEHFPNGIWLAELGALSDPSLVGRTVASAIGLSDESGRPPLELLARYFANKQALLLLDNCEHLVAASADLVNALLQACPQLHFLVTSRECLRLVGETIWPVSSLSVPILGDTKFGGSALAALGQYESIKLFAERARAVTQIFELDEQNVITVARLCQRLDGIPLAIELAAARTRLLSVEQLLDRLQDRFRLLTGGNRAALPRQQTLRALVDWSYDLLTDKERMLFDRLSIFVGGWTLEASEEVCADAPRDEIGVRVLKESLCSEEVLDLLGNLLEKSLVVAERPAAGAVRHRLLETLRQYAQERLAAGGEVTEEALRVRHANYFISLAEKVASGMRGPDQTEWAERLELEHDNIRSVLEWGAKADATPDRVELALRLAASLYAPWFRRGHGREGRKHFQALLSHIGAKKPTKAKARVLFAAGSLALWQDGDDSTAWVLLTESLELARLLGDSRVVADAQRNRGQVLCKRGDIAAATRCHEEALQLSRAEGDIYGIRWSLENLAEMAADAGDKKRASELFEEALSLARQSGDHHSIASILQSTGALACAAGNPENAAQLIGEGLSIMRMIGCNHCSSWFLGDLAGLASSSGDFGRAVRILGAAEALRERTGTVIPRPAMVLSEQTLQESRRRLGEAAYAEFLSEGQAMTLPQAVDYALSCIHEIGRASSPRPSPPPDGREGKNICVFGSPFGEALTGTFVPSPSPGGEG